MVLKKHVDIIYLFPEVLKKHKLNVLARIAMNCSREKKIGTNACHHRKRREENNK